MRLLYLSALGGGLDTNVRVLAPALVQAGHRVSILYVHYPGDKTPYSSEEFLGCQIYHRHMTDWHYYVRRALFGLTSLPSLIRDWEHAQTLARFVRFLNQRESLDLVEIPEVFVPAHGFGSVPYLVRLHSSAWMCRRLFGGPIPFSDRFERSMEARTLARARGLSSPSAFVADYIRGACQVRKPIRVIPYPINVAQFQPGKKALHPVVFFAGRVDMRKGADTLLRAMTHVLAHQHQCDFVFAGRLGADTTDLVKAALPQAKFLGPLPHEELIPWYQQAWVVVAPSVWDNSPNTVYEAMACGTPVIGSRVGGIPELVEDGVTGLLVPPGDAEVLAEAILALLADPTRREAMGRAGCEKAVAQFSVNTISAQMLAFYTSALRTSNI